MLILPPIEVRRFLRLRLLFVVVVVMLQPAAVVIVSSVVFESSAGPFSASVDRGLVSGKHIVALGASSRFADVVAAALAAAPIVAAAHASLGARASVRSSCRKLDGKTVACAGIVARAPAVARSLARGLVGRGVAGGITIRLGAFAHVAVVRRVGALAARSRTTAAAQPPGAWVAMVIFGVP